jgi:trk system potassium uptake protein TrkA
MRLLLAGAGRLALNVATHLRDVGHEVAVIDASADRTRIAFEKHGLVALTGDATEAGVLHDAEIERADAVVAMLPRDADNLAVAVQARVAGVKRVLVRLRDPSYRPLFERVGVGRTLSETDVVIGAFATAIEHDAVHHAMPLGAGHSLAFELVIPPGSAVAGQSIMAVAAQADFPRSCVFAGMYLPDGTVEAPRGSSMIVGGQAVLLVAHREDLAKVVAFFQRLA